MSAPLLWIFFPFTVALILRFLPNGRLVNILATGVGFFLSILALLITPDTAIVLGENTFRILPDFSFLGRNLTISASDQPFLVILFITFVFWSILNISINAPHTNLPMGLFLLSFLNAALAVEPFLYASLLIEIAVLFSIPLLISPQSRAGRGLLQFLTFQTLAVPFILFAGWLMTGVSASPGELSLALQAAIFLGLGFVFLLAIFPFNTWIPLLSEESHPLTMVFIIWLFSNISLIFGLNFLDSFSWIREATALPQGLRIVGLVTFVTAGMFSAFQTNLKRIFAYSMISEIGISLLSLSFAAQDGIFTFFGMLIPRTLALFLWALALSLLLQDSPSANFPSIKGLGRRLPLVALAVFLCQLSLCGIPLLAGFPYHQAIWGNLGQTSLTLGIWFGVALLGKLIAALRSLAVMTIPQDAEPFSFNEKPIHRILLSMGILLLLLLGLFPQWALPWISKLPLMFSHLGL